MSADEPADGVAAGPADDSGAAGAAGDVPAAPVAAEAPAAVLDELAASGRGRLPDPMVDAAAEAAERARERLARSAEHVVVAFAGPTGAGKSSLLNAVAGEEVSRPGPTRPTTPHAVAVAFGDGADELCDWVGVAERNRRPDGRLDGAVLVDLPDVDSVEAGHRAVAERVADRADMLVWVVDPLKYAQAVTHHEHLRRLAHHADVVVVALNHADRLDDAARRACLDDLRARLADDGLDAARVVVTSAVAAPGAEALAELVADEVAARRAPWLRRRADAEAALAEAAAALPDPEALALDPAPLRRALAEACDGARLRAEARSRYRRAARMATRSPARQVLGRLAGAIGLAARFVRGLLPGAGDRAVQPRVSADAVRRALLDAAEPLASRLPDPAAGRLRSLAGDRADALGRRARAALAGVPLAPGRRWWWRAALGLRTLLELAALAGLAWLLARAAALWLALPPPPMPAAVGEVPWPTALLLGGVAASALVGLAARSAARAGARRHDRRVAAEVDRRLDGALDEALGPVRDELDALRRLASLAREGRAVHQDPEPVEAPGAGADPGTGQARAAGGPDRG